MGELILTVRFRFAVVKIVGLRFRDHCGNRPAYLYCVVKGGPRTLQSKRYPACPNHGRDQFDVMLGEDFDL